MCNWCKDSSHIVQNLTKSTLLEPVLQYVQDDLHMSNHDRKKFKILFDNLNNLVQQVSNILCYHNSAQGP